MKTPPLFALALGLALPALAGGPPTIQGDYVEVRTCNVYAGGCFVNGEMGLTGKEAILVWSVRRGTWDGVSLDGLSVVAVVSADNTLENQALKPQSGRAVLIIDARADARQRAALASLARAQAGTLAAEVVSEKSTRVTVDLERLAERGIVDVCAPGLVEITALAGANKPAPCGAAELWYPPLSPVKNAKVAFTDWAAYKGDGLNRRWEVTSVYGGFVAEFAR